MAVSPTGNVTETREVQFSKAALPIEVTLEGTFRLISAEQPEKVWSPIEVMPCGQS